MSKDKLNLIEIPFAPAEPDEATKAIIHDAIENQPEYLKTKIAQSTAVAKCYESIALSLEDDRKYRKRYGIWIFISVWIYLIIILILVTFDSHLSDTTKLALLGTTSFNIIGLLAAVVRYLFSNNHHKFFDFPKTNNI